MSFESRHLGPSPTEQQQMLAHIRANSLDQLIDETIPKGIRLTTPLQLQAPLSEAEAITHLRQLGAQNQVFETLIGQGYSNTHTPTVILRNIFENPGWYTQYTPYQAEISQGRLEALFNFQTLVSELTGMDVANASLLDEATAAAEAMTLLHRARTESHAKSTTFWIVGEVFPATVAVIQTRAEPLGLSVVQVPSCPDVIPNHVFGALFSFPDATGKVLDVKADVARLKAQGVGIAVTTDLMALSLLKPPGEWGADVCVGSAQRLGVPLGYGGPHAGFMAVKDAFKRSMPGRIIGLSVDQAGNPAYRMALQTREQHIRREKATSNICTAQALLAIMASMYGVYHGPQGLTGIATQIHQLAATLAKGLTQMGLTVQSTQFFDTLCLQMDPETQVKIREEALKQKINFWYPNATSVQIALDETSTPETVDRILAVVAAATGQSAPMFSAQSHQNPFSESPLKRTSTFCTHPVFNTHHSESQMLRYIKSLENKDLSLTTSMIPLGSCTMKLNATTEMIPLSWPEWSSIHPFVPLDQAKGYQTLIAELAQDLATLTGFAACSLQPNSGAQGEYAGLLAIRRYQESRGEGKRTVVLIPSSAHGTNPATAALAGMSIVVVGCDESGNINVEELREKADAHKADLCALMITYPSTHGVFEENIQEICEIIHDHGGQVYMDGANMNAQVGLTHPGKIGADVCHLNLHKTFAIPHGGGGPGMGPICVAKHLAPFLPGHPVSGHHSTDTVSGAAWGSASILIISYLYIRMLGIQGVTNATKIAILNANYIKSRLEKDYAVLFQGRQGRVAHELIIDLKPFKKTAKIEAEDVAKRLMDYGFHAPTMSFPVVGTLMIEPTESEDKAELDRFCDALLQIRQEIRAIE